MYGTGRKGKRNVCVCFLPPLPKFITIIMLLLLLLKASKVIGAIIAVYKFYFCAYTKRIEGIIVIDSSILNVKHLRFWQVRWLPHVSQQAGVHSSLNQLTIHFVAVEGVIFL